MRLTSEHSDPDPPMNSGGSEPRVPNELEDRAPDRSACASNLSMAPLPSGRRIACPAEVRRGVARADGTRPRVRTPVVSRSVTTCRIPMSSSETVGRCLRIVDRMPPSVLLLRAGSPMEQRAPRSRVPHRPVGWVRRRHRLGASGPSSGRWFPR